MHRRIMRMQSTLTTKCWKSPEKSRVKSSRPMPKALTKKALTAPTDVWNMLRGTKQNLDAMVKGRTERYDHAAPFRRTELPDYPVHHVRGNRSCRRCRLSATSGLCKTVSRHLYEFGNEDQHSRFIPRICAGETMSMDLTEPDAGSDLQSVMLKATYDETRQLLAPERREAFHHERRCRPAPRAGTLGRGNKGRPRSVHVHLRQA